MPRYEVEKEDTPSGTTLAFKINGEVTRRSRMFYDGEEAAIAYFMLQEVCDLFNVKDEEDELQEKANNEWAE